MKNMGWKAASRFLTLGLLSFPLAALTYSGEVRYDTHVNLGQQAQGSIQAEEGRQTPDLMAVSRARVDFQGEPMAFWRYHVRIQKSEEDNSQLDLNVFLQDSSMIGMSRIPSSRQVDTAALPVQVAQAYMAYHELDAISLYMGLIPVPEVSCHELAPSALIGDFPQNAQLGTAIRRTGNHLGLKVKGQVLGLNYQLGVWKQSPYPSLNTVPPFYTRTILDQSLQNARYPSPGAIALEQAQHLITTTDQGPITTDFHDGPIKWAYGARINWVADLPYNVYYSAALGYSHAPLNVPIVAAVFGAFDNLENGDLDAPNYVMASYDYLTQATFDFNWASTIVHTQLGYQYQKLHSNSQQHYYTSTDIAVIESETIASEAFHNTPKTSACWAQWGAMLTGGRYKFDTKLGVVSGVKVPEGNQALEVVLRGGMVLRKNIMALLDQQGFDDYSTTDQSEPLALADPRLDLVSLVALDDEHRYLLLMINNSGRSEQNTAYENVSIVSPNERAIAFQSRMIGWSAGLNYYPFESVAMRLTYRFEHYHFKKEVSTHWVDSLSMKNRQTLSLRCETSF